MPDDPVPDDPDPDEPEFEPVLNTLVSPELDDSFSTPLAEEANAPVPGPPEESVEAETCLLLNELPLKLGNLKLLSAASMAAQSTPGASLFAQLVAEQGW